MPTQGSIASGTSQADSTLITLETGEVCQVHCSRTLLDKEEIMLLRSQDGGSDATEPVEDPLNAGLLIGKGFRSNYFTGPGWFKIRREALPSGNSAITVYFDT